MTFMHRSVQVWAVRMAGGFRFRGAMVPRGYWLVRVAGSPQQVLSPREFAAEFGDVESER